MLTNISPAAQDYLKAIYVINERYGRATTSQIAEQLEVRPASVTGMLQKMAQEDPPLVTYKKHQGVFLTDAGHRAALEMMRHHRLLELFLHEILDYTWDEVHAEAERLEHVISEDMERRIARVLGDPARDPHGHPIPTYELEIETFADFPMSELRTGQTAVIQRVHDHDPDLLRYLDQLGLKPQIRFRVQNYIPFDQNMHLQIIDQDNLIVVGPRITDEIFVELVQM